MEHQWGIIPVPSRRFCASKLHGVSVINISCINILSSSDGDDTREIPLLVLCTDVLQSITRRQLASFILILPSCRVRRHHSPQLQVGCIATEPLLSPHSPDTFYPRQLIALSSFKLLSFHSTYIGVFTLIQYPKLFQFIRMKASTYYNLCHTLAC